MIKAPNGSMFCKFDHLVQYASSKNNISKAKAKAHTKQKKQFQANDIKLRKKMAQTAFNAFIRKRDEKESCISCDKPKDWSGQWHSGHYKTTKARPDLRFNEDNCHKQCSVCNNFLSANIEVYMPSLISKIGKDRFNALTLERQVKYNCEQLKAIELKYKTKLKELD